ncbi:bifunctional PIG-L family deacetylase/class I SAM-dependent methyltransferase [Isoptericola halotolerans]|uniref:PIG-L family deacetylase n=1 Tax=Isoptericola halotolerans TaxID=300560 RepID=UPI00388E1D85
MTFDHRDPGTSEDAWVRAGILERTEPLHLPPVDALVVVAAHPDDESFGAAGLIRRLASGGVPTTVVVATDGEASHERGTVPTDELRAVRRREVVTALAALSGTARLVLLGLPDGGLRERRRELAAALDAVIDVALGTADGGRVALAAPWRGDGHRDHRIAGEVAADLASRRGAVLVEYPVWWWHWGDPEDASGPWDRLRALALTAEESAAKSKALAAHASQVQPFAPGVPPVLGSEMLRHAARSVEVFVTAGTEAPLRADPTTSLGRDFFDRFYTGRDDPWGFESRWYEERKRALLLAALPRQRFRAGLELGCSTGVLTADLAARCDRLVGVDVADAPLDAARRRLGEAVELARLDTPDEWPAGAFDLVVLSEVLYYYGSDDLDRALDRVVGSLAPDGAVVACHWRHDVPEYPLSGDEVHARLRDRDELTVLARHEEEDFLLEVHVPGPATSVARATGLL